MGSLERSKKKVVRLWKKAVFHFLLCFIMGFFSGFAPGSKSSIILNNHHHHHDDDHHHHHHHVVALNRSDFSPQSVEMLDHQSEWQSGNFNRSLLDEPEIQTRLDTNQNGRNVVAELEAKELHNSVPRRLVIVVTPTNARDDQQLRGILLTKLANTLKLVPPPLLWVVVESQSDTSEVSDTLRKTGVMYRHLVFKENFTDVEAEMDHQRNVALNHIEHHRLSGLVHFADLSNVYDLNFFDEIRAIEVFGTWPVALLSANRNRVRIEGPVCDSSEVIGWHLKKMNNLTDARSPVHISSFAFNSSILWDPERWGRLSAAQDTSQNSIEFVEKEVLEEETRLNGIPSEDCSKVMLWNLRIPGGLSPLFLNHS